MILQQFEHITLAELPKIISKIVSLSEGEKIWRLEGSMGAGKTTFVNFLAKHFEIEDHTSSPTFSLVNEYHNRKREIFYHFDFYRLKNEREALDFGFLEYLDSGNYCWMEWASQVENLLPESYLWIDIVATSPQERTITVKRHGRV
jgi:tRNA threonylcarbamoyladenosine biosynthesis protein TsaE